MPYYARKPRAKRTGAKRGATKAKRMQPVSQAVKRYVNRTVHNNIENQTKSVVYLNNGVNAATGYSQPLIPNPTQGGSDVEKRRGNEISVRGGYIKGYVNLLPYSDLTNPRSTVHVRMMLVSMKSANQATFDATGIWQYGNTSLGIQGNIGDALYQVNRDLFTVYEQKSFTLGASSLTQSVSTISPNIMSNFKSAQPFYFNWGKHVKQKLKYNDNVALCSNRNLFLFVTASYSDGGTTGTPVEIHFLNQYDWEDA